MGNWVSSVNMTHARQEQCAGQCTCMTHGLRLYMSLSLSRYVYVSVCLSVSVSICLCFKWPKSNIAILYPVAETWRRVWGDGKFFRGPRFLNYVFFRKKFPFSPRKFLMTFF